MPKRRMSMPPTPSKRQMTRRANGFPVTLGRVIRRNAGALSRRIPGTVLKYAGPLGQAYAYGQVAMRGIRAVSKYNKYIQKARGNSSRKKSSTNSGNQTVSRGNRGAAFSKSSGKFGGKLTDSKIKPFLNSGVVQTYELGGVNSEASRQVCVIGHSTAPANRILFTGIGALLKLLFKKAGIKIKNWNDLILQDANIPARIAIFWKEKEGQVLQKTEFAISTTKQFTQLIDDVAVWVRSFSAIDFPTMFTGITYYHDVGVIGSSRLIAYEIDLTNTTLDFYCRSDLKLQNRTVTTSTNDQADDVDNVPIYGKHFLTKYNGTIFRDYNTPAANGNPELRTEPDFGALYYATLPSATGTTLYNEIPDKPQFVGCLSAGPAHLDPGQVKTSKLETYHKINFNRLMSLIKTKVTAGTYFPVGVPFYLGQTRIFCFEKMINSVAMSAETAFKLAFEINVTVACIAKSYDNNQTAKNVAQLIV